MVQIMQPCTLSGASTGAAFSKPCFFLCLVERGIFPNLKEKAILGVRCEKTRQENCKNAAQNKDVGFISDTLLFHAAVVADEPFR